MYLQIREPFGQIPTGGANQRGAPPPPIPLPPAVTQDFKIVAKSYIAPIGSSIGATRCAIIDPSAVARVMALALTTDAAFSENPLHDRKDTKYRLYSSRTFRATCAGGKAVDVIASPLDTGVGQECVPRTTLCLQPPPMTIVSSSLVRTGPSTFHFSWIAKGRPPRMAEPGFQLVCPRTSWFIWHMVSGVFDCRGPTGMVTTRLKGSKFPSHRVFVNGSLVHTVPQGPFANLWVPARADITMVA